MNDLKIIKIGGKLIDDEAMLNAFLKDFAEIKEPKVLIHGGGTIASQISNELGITVKQIDGRRITDDATLDIITMAYAGKINKNIVARLQALDCNALGLTGADGNSITSKIRDKSPIDFGHVGDPVKVNTTFIQSLLDQEITSVFCAITHDGAGQLLNTNADTVAAVLSSAFALRNEPAGERRPEFVEGRRPKPVEEKAYRTKLYYCFEKAGVLRNINDESSLIEHINFKQYQQLKNDGVIADGMLPKLQNSFEALENGVSSVHIGLPSMINSNINHTTLSL
ncbi:acetylglutamate kinase [Nonlabens ponticola]|nr:acetylglutamate kinase [Nonlabens ponticola]